MVKMTELGWAVRPGRIDKPDGNQLSGNRRKKPAKRRRNIARPSVEISPSRISGTDDGILRARIQMQDMRAVTWSVSLSHGGTRPTSVHLES